MAFERFEMGKSNLHFALPISNEWGVFFGFFFLVQQTEFLAHHISNSLIHIYLTMYLFIGAVVEFNATFFFVFVHRFYFFYTYNSNNHRNRDTFPSATVVNAVCVLCIAPSSEQIHVLYLQLNWSCFWFWCCCRCRCRCRCHCCRAGSDVPFQSIHIYCISGKAASKRATFTFTFALTWFHLFAKLWIQIIPIFQFSLLLKWGFCHHLMLVRYVHTSAACMYICIWLTELV